MGVILANNQHHLGALPLLPRPRSPVLTDLVWTAVWHGDWLGHLTCSLAENHWTVFGPLARELEKHSISSKLARALQNRHSPRGVC